MCCVISFLPEVFFLLLLFLIVKNTSLLPVLSASFQSVFVFYIKADVADALKYNPAGKFICTFIFRYIMHLFIRVARVLSLMKS